MAAMLTTVLLAAQIDPKYDKGAISEVDGKVVFSKSIAPNKSITDQQLFEKVSGWADKYYNSENNKREKQRVLLVDSEKKQIACSGDMLLVFGKKLLSFDSSPMLYQMILTIENGRCDATMRNIHYLYQSGGDREEDLSAEETITDKVAINKKGTKLNFFYDKFRRTTIDSVEQIYASLEEAINGKASFANQPTEKEIQYVYVDKSTGKEVDAPVSTPVEAPKAQVATPMPMPIPTPATLLSGFKKVSIQDTPKDFIKLLEKLALVTITKDGKTIAATWAGTNDFFGKQVSMVVMNSQDAATNTLESGDTYTISFFTSASREALTYVKGKGLVDIKDLQSKGLNAGATDGMTIGFGEASIIIECRKITDQSLKNTSINIDEFKSDIPAEWQKNGLDKLYFNVGEILNVWVK